MSGLALRLAMNVRRRRTPMIDKMPLVECEDCDLLDDDCTGAECKARQRLSDLKWIRELLDKYGCKGCPIRMWEWLDQLIKECEGGAPG